MPGKPLPSEFDLIERYLAPLASGEPGAYGLGDDAAVLGVPEGREVVITTDTLVDGVHFPTQTAPGLIATRALAVNLSDLAAMGASPRAYFLSLGLPQGGRIDEPWIEAFTDGLKAAQDRYGVTLAGGDTVAVPGAMVVSVTALGTVLAGQAVRRSGARPRDLICVSGTIGDAALGLRVRKGGLSGLKREERLFLGDRFDTPQPRLALGEMLAGVATAALDISDGLAADLGHLARQSKVRAVVNVADIPLSGAARAAVHDEHSLLGSCVLGGGDDYELVFTLSPDHLTSVKEAAQRIGVPVSVIGAIEEGQTGVHFVDAQGDEIAVPKTGYQHF